MAVCQINNLKKIEYAEPLIGDMYVACIENKKIIDDKEVSELRWGIVTRNNMVVVPYEYSDIRFMKPTEEYRKNGIPDILLFDGDKMMKILKLETLVYWRDELRGLGDMGIVKKLDGKRSYPQYQASKED